MMKPKAFTLVELLVVVAIIAILASIALPNFLEAQVRSKVSRVKADMRTIAMAMETYHVDNNAYPQANFVPRFRRFRPLTTPIAYLTTVPQDPFNPVDSGSSSWRRTGDYRLGTMSLTSASRWALASDGPNLVNNTEPIRFYPGFSQALFFGGVSGFDYTLYDPTNGTISRGDIFRASDFIPN
ncbi:MAG: prepilin-type N-terminal cleavage/methylation domain-containing protein [Candidatus Sumerlaeia bacterium]|nr:prepilin-type N-terminal cleavage/methylation domain-containing protein [Candidatus Sumerlaeia bacterium]